MTSQKDYDRRFSGFQDDPWRKYKTQKTVSLIVTFFSLGLSAAVLGPTIVSMEILLGTDTKRISAVFTGGSLGYLIGAILCGVIYAKLNKELLFAVSLIGIGGALAYMPFSPHLFVFIASYAVQGVFMGIIDAAGQSYLLKIWEDHKYRQPLMQGMHGVWSIGATIGPLIVRPFLAALPEAYQPEAPDNETTNGTTGGVDVFLNVTNIPDNSSSVDGDDDWAEEISFVRFAYVVIASLIFVSSVLFVALFFMMSPSCLDPSRKRNENDQQDSAIRSKTQRNFMIKLLVFLFVYYFVYAWVEMIPSNLLAVFTVKGLGWPNDHGALVTSAYYAALGIGRLLGIPMAVVMSPRNMLIVDLTVVTLGFGLLFFIRLHGIVMWVAACVFGLGMGSIFPSGILWAEGYIEITGVASSLIMAASSLGSMVGPALTGYLMDEFTHDCFVYVLFSAILACIAVYTGAVIFASKVGVQRSKKKKYVLTQEKRVSQELNAWRNHVEQTQPCEAQVETEQTPLKEHNGSIHPTRLRGEHNEETQLPQRNSDNQFQEETAETPPIQHNGDIITPHQIQEDTEQTPLQQQINITATPQKP